MSKRDSRLTRGIYAAAIPGIILGLYAIGLVCILYTTYRTNEDENIANFHLNTCRGANTVAYFLKERQQEIAQLAQNPFVRAYFQNKALGVELGLAQNRIAIKNEFEILLKQKRYIGGRTIYSSIILYDTYGKPVTHISRPLHGDSPSDEKIEVADTGRFMDSLSPGPTPDTLIISAPTRIRGKTVGWLAATVSWSDVFARLLNEFSIKGSQEEDKKRNVALFYKGALLYSEGFYKLDSKIFAKIYLDYLRPEYPSNSYQFSWNRETLLSSVAPVKLTPFCLVRIYPKCHVTHIYKTRLIFWLLLIFLALLLLWMFWAFRKGVQSISLKYEVKEAEALAQSKGEFLSTMSHEIRTPLNGLLGALFLIDKEDVKDVARQYIDIAITSGQRLMTLIDEILQLARIEEGRIKVKEEPFSPAKLVEDVVDMCAGLLKGNMLRLYMYVDTPEMVIGDETKISQLLINLVSNSIKFTEKGWVKISVQCIRNEESLNLCLTVEDTGCGIPTAMQKKIFNAFEQGPYSSNALQGTGLGLAIIKKIAEIVGGNIELTSAEGKGTRFSITVPVKELDLDYLAEQTEEGETLRCLLLMEDNLLQRIIVKYLERWNLHVIQGNFKAKIFKKHFYATDIIITDSLKRYDELFVRCFRGKERQGARKIICILPPGPDMSGKISVEYEICRIKSPVKFSILHQCIFEKALQHHREAPSDAKNQFSKPFRCLLVEDNSLNQMITSTMLQKMGIEKVDITSNGTQAVKIIEGGKRYDFIIMDCHMPDMDGFEATKKIREIERKRGVRTPVIALSAQVMNNTREKCKKAQMDEFLAKPVTPKKLKETIEAAVYGCF